MGAAVAQRAGDVAACRHHARQVADMEQEGNGADGFGWWVDAATTLGNVARWHVETLG